MIHIAFPTLIVLTPFPMPLNPGPGPRRCSTGA